MLFMFIKRGSCIVAGLKRINAGMKHVWLIEHQLVRLVMKTNGPSAAAAAAAAVAGVLAIPPRHATPETLSLDSITTHPPTAAENERSNTALSQVGIRHGHFNSQVS